MFLKNILIFSTIPRKFPKYRQFSETTFRFLVNWKLFEISPKADNENFISRCRIACTRVGVIVFPEGTRHLKGDHLLPFKKGCFHMAKQGNNLKLVPVVISTFQPIIDWKNKRFQCGTVTVSVLEPIESDDLSVEELTETAYNKMDEEYLRLNSFMNNFNRCNSKDK